MCGIAGFINPDATATVESLRATATKMASTVAHRGPDDAGVWVDASVGVAFGHRRLSIIDLSPQGHQPMESSCGRFVITYNGEIYNFLELRNTLESNGRRFRGRSDTEVLLEGIAQWGVSASLRRCHGMWAFTLWDRAARTLYLSRDRMGEKPLYFGVAGDSLLFGSELKALRAHPEFQATVDRSALALYFRLGYIPAPHSIYARAWKLLPGTVLALPVENIRTCRTYDAFAPYLASYWTVKGAAETGIASPFEGDEPEAVTSLDELLRDAISGQMIADVPLGALLSGGIDSSTVAALMQAQSHQRIKTFTIGFHEPGFNEANHAKAVAEHLGTDHTDLYVTPEQAMTAIPKLPCLYDEPFGDSSQIPTVLLSELVRTSVTVGLSGDGGDECFGGYKRYFSGRRLWNGMRWIPQEVREAFAKVLTSISPVQWDSISRGSSFVLGKRTRQGRFGEKVHKVAGILHSQAPLDMYRELVSMWKDPVALVFGHAESPTILTERTAWPRFEDFIHEMMFLDQVTYLPDDILVKVDRASMGAGLEVRAPLLDDRVVQFAWRVPMTMKIRNSRGKWLLRKVLAQYVPKALFDRPKMGFGVPIDVWLRGPLRDWAEQLLDAKRLQQGGLIDPAPVREKWEEHLSGRRNWQYLLWNVLMFQAWCEANPRPA